MNAVAPLGLKTSGAGLVPPRDMIGIFPVVSETPAWVDRSALGKRLWKIEQAFYEQLNYSPDGQRLVVARGPRQQRVEHEEFTRNPFAAGIEQRDLIGKGVGPVALENTVRYRSELRAGDEVEVTCRFVWGERKTFRIEQTVVRADGRVAATVSGLGGLLDLKERKMVADPREYFRALASDPRVLGL